MRKRNRKKSDILIDLTSLLDVVFIILLVVICREQKLTVDQKEQTENLAVLEQQAQAQYELYLDQLDTAEQINDYFVQVSVNSSYNKEDITDRIVSVLRKGEKETKTFNVLGQNSQIWTEFRVYLKDYIEQNPEKPVILSLNEGDEKILYRDEKMIKKIFEELSETYKNVYIK